MIMSIVSLNRKVLPYLVLTTALLFLWHYHSTTVRETWRTIPQSIGLGDKFPVAPTAPEATLLTDENEGPVGAGDSENRRLQFEPGKPGKPGTTYNRTLVVPRLLREDVNWMDEELPDIHKAIYVADLPTAPLHPPTNKGHEVMIYLTYIIDHYYQLPDVSIFMHSHRWSWHNDDLLGQDAVGMVNRLSSERVIREGYMNMRCHWNPGCPDWMHPGKTKVDRQKPEEVELAKAWSELFPDEPIPKVLGSPCCSQFALSRDRIHSLPLSTYEKYRDWVIRTPLDDAISGRVWEYAWQFVFTGRNILCPPVSECYCDGFGVCYGGEDEINAHFAKRAEVGRLNEELRQWKELDKMIQDAIEAGGMDETADITVPEPGKDKELQERIDQLNAVINRERDEAITRGEDPEARAKEAGRDWHEGDGF